MTLNEFNLHLPKTLDEAVRILSNNPEAKILSGGTILINHLKTLKKRNLSSPKDIISLKKINELKTISSKNNELRIGGMTTLSELINNKSVPENLSALQCAAGCIATTPIRNMATLGGNITSRYVWTELSAVCVAFEADFVFVTASGQTNITADDFFKNNAKSDGILKEIVIRNNPAARAIYKRVAKSSPVDVPLLSLCIKADNENSKLTNCIVAVNNNIKFTQRDCRLEQFLNNKNCADILKSDLSNHLDASIYETSTNEYQTHMFKVLIKNTVNELCRQL